MSLARIRDQEIPVRMLGNMIARERIPHGLLFWGPSGVGKGLAAKEFAKAIHCRGSSRDGCGDCLSCRKIESGNHPDLSVISPLKKSRIIDVETIESINEMASLRPFESEWRVFILRDADRMRPPAQNHFLKTLEEPPGKSLFILTTAFPQWLLPTIRSRCQRVRFRGLQPETIADLLLADRDMPREAALSIAHVAQGQMTRAVSLADSDKRDVVIDIAQRLDGGDDPVDLAHTFAQHLAAERKRMELSLKADQDEAADVHELTSEDREHENEKFQALVDAATRQDLLDYLYLFETWYRDKLVCSVTGEASRAFNRDKVDLLMSGGNGDESKIAAIEQARVYLERFLNEERVFRDLFFTLAE